MKIRQLVETTYENDIDLSVRNIVNLPSDLPDTVSNKFWCDNNRLTSLKGSPSHVGGSFHCQFNQLTSLKGSPSHVGGVFYCDENDLTSLEYCPSQVGGNFRCEYNSLSSLQDIHTQITKIGGSFYCRNNPIKSHILGLMLIEIGRKIVTGLGNGSDVDRVLNKWKNQGRRGVLGAQRELLDLGYKELARL